MRSPRPSLSRRRALRGAGIAGISVGLPKLEAMFSSRGLLHATAQAAAASPARRLIILHWPTGVSSPATWWFPKEADTGWKVTEGLRPLDPYRSDFNILSGLGYGPFTAVSGDSHNISVSFFTGYQGRASGQDSYSNAASVFVSAGKVLASPDTKFPYLSSSIYEDAGVFSYFPWSAPGVRDPLETNPTRFFNRVFSDPSIDPKAAATALARDKSVLDFVKAEASDLQKILGAADRFRVDQHLSAIRDLETSLLATPSAVCATTKPKEGVPDISSANKGHESDPAYQGWCVGCGGPDTTPYIRTMIALHLTAHRCDLTRSSFISLGMSQTGYSFPELGLPYPYHNITHDIPDAMLPASVHGDGYRKIGTYFMGEVANFIGELKKDEGMGSLLDDAAVVITTELSDGSMHTGYPIPCLVLGKARLPGATAMATGRNIVSPRSRCVNDLWTSALIATGALAPGEKFGDPTLDTKPIEGLWV